MKLKSASIAVSPVEKINTHIDSESPHIPFNQMYIMSHQHQAASSNTLKWTDPHNLHPMHLDTTCNYISYVHSRKKLTRSKLLKGEDWTSWEAS